MVWNYFTDLNIDLAVLTETWLKSEDESWVAGCDLNVNQFRIQTLNRSNKKVGGLAIVYKHTYKVKKQPNLKKCNSFEYAIWKVTGKSVTVIILAIYHPPYTKSNLASNTNFIDEFLEFLVHFIPKYQNFIITGDFNLHMDNSNDLYGNILKDNIKALGLDQHVNFPTHHSGHTLDLVITEHHNMSSQIVQCESGKFLSDHCAVVCVLNIKKEDIISETKTFRNQRELDVEKLITLFSNINLDSSTHIDGLVEIFQKNVSCILDEYAPEVTRTVIHRKRKPWFNETIQAVKHQLRRREYVWRKYREHHQWTALKKN